jgi:hypothetical protein
MVSLNAMAQRERGPVPQAGVRVCPQPDERIDAQRVLVIAQGPMESTLHRTPHGVIFVVGDGDQ